MLHAVQIKTAHFLNELKICNYITETYNKKDIKRNYVTKELLCGHKNTIADYTNLIQSRMSVVNKLCFHECKIRTFYCTIDALIIIVKDNY